MKPNRKKSKRKHLHGGLAAIVVCAALAAWLMGMFDREAWSDDFDKSLELAAEKDKVLLVNFTGSDWCAYCIKLHKEVFSKDEFKEGVKDGFVLAEVDFPKGKKNIPPKISPERLKRNRELEKEYLVEGFPTVLLLDGKGVPFAATGYKKIAPADYVANLRELAFQKDRRDKAFARAGKSQGVEKARELVTALTAMGLDEPLLIKFYGSQINAIREADPADETGFIRMLGLKMKFREFEEAFKELAGDGMFKEALELTAKMIGSGEYSGRMLQDLVFIEALIHTQAKDYGNAIMSLDKAAAVVPDSPKIKLIATMKARILRKQDEIRLKAGQPAKAVEPAKAEAAE